MNNAKYKFFLLVFLSAVMFFPSCEKQQLEDALDEDSLIYGHLSEILSEELFTHEEFVRRFAGQIDRLLSVYMPDMSSSTLGLIRNIGNLERSHLDASFASEQNTPIWRKPEWRIKRVIFMCNTTDHNGDPTQVRCCAYYPVSLDPSCPHKIPILASLSNTFSPGPTFNCISSFPFSVGKVYQDALLVLTDYEGFDPEKELRQNVFQAELLAMQQLDVDLAVLELIENEADACMANDYYTENLGVSRGGMVALAFAKYYDTDAPDYIVDRIRMAGSYCATAPYVQEPLFENMINNRPNMGYNSHYLSFFISSTMRSSPELFKNWTYSDFLSDEFNSFRIDYEGKRYTLFELTELPLVDMPKYLPYYIAMDGDVARMVSPDLLKPDSTLNYESEKYKALKASMEKNNVVTGWTPKHPIRIAYCPSDEFVPASIGEYTYRTLLKASDAANGPSVTVHRLLLPSSITGIDHHSLSSFYYMAYLGVTPKPWHKD